jgi:galactokinase
MTNELLKTVANKYTELYGGQPYILLTSNGRANIIGEHTDYYLGYVFPFAIDKGIAFAAAKSDVNEIFSLDFDGQYNHVANHENGTWESYIYNTLILLNERLNIDIKLKMTFGGNLPIGAGVSSSSSLCCGLIEIVSRLYNVELDMLTKIKLAQMVEHGVGVNGGLMDQYSIFNGHDNSALLMDCRTLTHESIEVPKDWVFMLINSGVKHNLVNTEYNIRRAQGESGVAKISKDHPEIKVASDLPLDLLESYQDKLETKEYNRLIHLVHENTRVHDLKKSLLENDITRAGQLINESHHSLRDLYEVSCEELDLLQSLAEQSEMIAGSRMMGGGFGGCTINLVNQELSPKAMEKFLQPFQEKYGYTPNYFYVRPATGIVVHE